MYPYIYKHNSIIQLKIYSNRYCTIILEFQPFLCKTHFFIAKKRIFSYDQSLDKTFEQRWKVMIDGIQLKCNVLDS